MSGSAIAIDRMCYYRLHIFTTCGHTSFSPNPVRQCRESTTYRLKLMTRSALTPWLGCPIRTTHPLQTFKVERLCNQCQTARDNLLYHLDSAHVIRVDDTKWKVSYAAPEAVWQANDPKLGLLERVRRRDRAGAGQTSVPPTPAIKGEQHNVHWI
ncbi:hypothetical protein BDZ85DRAFT_255189 [Elsinoe ampelina]|uniref:Uncharacterized protein n=1 Tax=Elsinoe ampelina TaxID=302913 RepID=A0A6A6GR41_9PEZI|nr:hypothetical protein BDZ85DRAFT_255189 [Elsinoe ampelina]